MRGFLNRSISTGISKKSLCLRLLLQQFKLETQEILITNDANAERLNPPDSNAFDDTSFFGTINALEIEVVEGILVELAVDCVATVETNAGSTSTQRANSTPNKHEQKPLLMVEYTL